MERSNRRQLGLLAALVYVLLILVGYVMLNLFLQAYVAGLVQSQSYAVAVQEWRGVVNGILSGWSFFPPLRGVCIYGPREPLFLQAACENVTGYAGFWRGDVVELTSFGYAFRIAIAYPLWIWSLLFPVAVLVPAFIAYAPLRRPLVLQAQLELIKRLNAADEQARESSRLERKFRGQAQEILELRRQALLAQLAAQVSHDIRSPLAVLHIVVDQAHGLTEETRGLLQSAVDRIRDIASDLLQRNRENQRVVEARPKGVAGAPPAAGAARWVGLGEEIQAIVSQKRIQYSGRPELAIGFENGLPAGVGGRLPAVEFGRVISNLIDNAVEAITGPGSVQLHAFADQGAAVLLVRDTGGGIPPETLAEIGRPGFVSRKPNGSGLGLLHARQSLAKWGGGLEIESPAGRGTLVRLRIRTSAAPTVPRPET